MRRRPSRAAASSISCATACSVMFLSRAASWPLLPVSVTTAAAAFFLFPLLERASFLMAVAFLLGLGLGMSQPMVMSLLHNTAPAGRVGEAIGVRMSLVNMSQIAMPLLFGALGTALRMLPVFWAHAPLLSLGGLYARRRR